MNPDSWICILEYIPQENQEYNTLTMINQNVFGRLQVLAEKKRSRYPGGQLSKRGVIYMQNGSLQSSSLQ